jgi:hypothetical protein
MSDSEGDDLPLFEGASEDEYMSGDNENEGDTYKTQERKMMEAKKASNKRSEEPTEVDDDFFKLRDMEAFLDLEDKRMEAGEPYDDGDGEDIDMFDNIDDEDDKPVNYKDYFNDDQEIDDWLEKKRPKGFHRNANIDESSNANAIPLGKRKTDDTDLDIEVDDILPEKVFLRFIEKN